ncbi:MAG: FmdE family protein [Pseudomonadota bacterium]
MTCSIDQTLIEQTIAFHGHNCPGLTIGLRASELALEKLNPENKADWVCITETDMCGVDAIQFLTGCSFGKGNLIHKDFGKSAFTFFDRKAQKGFRALFSDRATQSENREERIQMILNAPLKDLFEVQTIDLPPVRPARILMSIKCDHCNEMTMESRIRLFGGKHLCGPCFEKVEQKI